VKLTKYLTAIQVTILFASILLIVPLSIAQESETVGDPSQTIDRVEDIVGGAAEAVSDGAKRVGDEVKDAAEEVEDFITGEGGGGAGPPPDDDGGIEAERSGRSGTVDSKPKPAPEADGGGPRTCGGAPSFPGGASGYNKNCNDVEGRTTPGGTSSSSSACTGCSGCSAPSDGSCSYSNDCDGYDSWKEYSASCNCNTCNVDSTTKICSRRVEPEAKFTYSQDAENIRFDASDSEGYVDSVDEYNWDFGDGNTETTSDPVTFHEYGEKGKYTATLTVGDTCSYTDKESKTFLWLEFNGTEVDHTEITDPSNRWDLEKDQTKTDQCVYNGEKRNEGTKIDVGKDKPSIELGGHSIDKEVCVSDPNSGIGGRWWDKDTQPVINLIGGKEENFYKGAWGGRTLPATEEADTEIGN